MSKSEIVETSTKPVETSIEQDFNNILAELMTQKGKIVETIGKVKKLQKDVAKNLKKKGGSKDPNKKREPSGFTKPTKISKDLSDFFGKPIGTELARTEVTKLLSVYIKNNHLQLEEDKRKILPDKKLCKLLNCKKDDDVTYFNLQRWLKPHFC